MRKLWTSTISVTLVLASCGFEDQPPASNVGGTSGTPLGGSAPTAGTGSSTAGSSSVAGQAGNGGSGVLPQGGSTGQGGTGTAGTGTAGVATGGTAGSGTAGAGGTGGSGGSGPVVDPRFKLKWRDDFDSFNDARWSKQSHTFEENLARFTANNVVVEGGFLKLKVTKVASEDREYSAAEVATKESFTYGRFAGRIKFSCPKSGMVSSLFTYKQDVSDSWQEIDIEFLGRIPNGIQYNLISGTAANRVYQPQVVNNLPWSPAMEFHEYALEWAPDGITFFIDGAQTWKGVQPKIKDAQTLHMNAWPANYAATQFAGPFEPTAVPCEAQYDWVEAYTYSP